MLRNDGTCSICTKLANNPYRHFDSQGNIIEGCIDKCHDKYISKPSNSWRWVLSCRKVIKKIILERRYI